MAAPQNVEHSELTAPRTRDGESLSRVNSWQGSVAEVTPRDHAEGSQQEIAKGEHDGSEHDGSENVGSGWGSGSVALVCNCRLRLLNKGTGEVATVKARKWDCPSCGRDKSRKLAEMCGAVTRPRMITGTWQPVPWVSDDAPPAGFEACDPRDHVWRDARGRQLVTWHIKASCAHCVKRVTRQYGMWLKRLRRKYGNGVQVLRVIEDHASGAMHLHMAVVGVPEVVTNKSRAGRWIRRQWREVGGGTQMDLGHAGEDGRNAGWYIAKYLAKRHTQKVARHHRRWSRTRSFAPEVHMVDPPEPHARERRDEIEMLAHALGASVVAVEGLPDLKLTRPMQFQGYLHPLTDDVLRARVWLSEPAPT